MANGVGSLRYQMFSQWPRESPTHLAMEGCLFFPSCFMVLRTAFRLQGGDLRRAVLHHHHNLTRA